MPVLTTLRRRADFLAAAQSGCKCAKHSVIVQARRRAENELSPSPIRIGFTATRKLGGAVIRNRAKRRLRAAAAQIVPELGAPGCDYVFIGREATIKGAFDDLIRDMKHALKRLADQMQGAEIRDQGSANSPPPDPRPPTL
jgi:ribonuclease P protein component